jgi:hypothetical protein
MSLLGEAILSDGPEPACTQLVYLIRSCITGLAHHATLPCDGRNASDLSGRRLGTPAQDEGGARGGQAGAKEASQAG